MFQLFAPIRNQLRKVKKKEAKKFINVERLEIQTLFVNESTLRVTLDDLIFFFLDT